MHPLARDARLRGIGLVLAGLIVQALLRPAPSPALAAARDYAVDAEASSLRVVLHRQGALSVLAHDHVLVAKGLAGRIAFNPDAPAASSGEISIPVALLEVDDPKERAREGFTGELNESNRASVRENLLAPDQLAAAAFPRITVALERVEGGLPSLRLRLRVRIRQQEQTVTVPVTVALGDGTLTVRGETELLQSAFGITPYVALFGAIAVQDAVQVRFALVARPSRP